MYLNLDELKALSYIVSELTIIDNEEEQKLFLSEHVEDVSFFLETIKQAKKLKTKKKEEYKQNVVEEMFYTEEGIYEILSEKNNDEIAKEFPSSELKKMYASVYKKMPPSSYTKDRIISTLRNRMHSIKRAESFQWGNDIQH